MSTLQNFGVPLGDNATRGGIIMPKLKNRFRMFVNNFAGVASPIGFTQQVITAARPSVNFNPQTVHSYNSIAYFAGKAEWETIAITVRDDVTNVISSLIGAQLQCQMNFFEQTVPLAAGDYKFNMQLQTLDGSNAPTGSESVLEEWDYEGCFIATTNYQGFDYSSSDAMTIEMTIRFDNATQIGGLMPDPAPSVNGISFSVT